MDFFTILSSVITGLGFIYIAVIIFGGIYDCITSAVQNHRSK